MKLDVREESTELLRVAHVVRSVDFERLLLFPQLLHLLLRFEEMVSSRERLHVKRRRLPRL